MNLAKYSLDNTKVIYFFLAVLLIGGVFSFGKLGKKEDAPFVIKSAVIMTRYPGAEPAEVERLITEPISREIQSMSGVYKIKSESMYGISKITFELLPSLPASSIPQKWDELRRKVLNMLVEAMVCGVPPVSFACPCGPRDIIDDSNDGLLVPKENINKLAEKIGYLISHENIRKEMGQRARIHVERFKIDHIASQWKELFNSLIS
ncbi:efflux RND transporter permease subunit [Bacteroides fragilis]|uniref:efflux RND transporter permease subunit n=1 Tax=Bacteroides fragilis TaxID=817 RepID=UPI0005CF71F4